MNKAQLIYELTSEKVVEEWERDLIMLGTHGRTGLLHLLIGSVAEKVISIQQNHYSLYGASHDRKTSS
jgi:Universal stress protein UspA and related nucleotide-binding proteins